MGRANTHTQKEHDDEMMGVCMANFFFRTDTGNSYVFACGSYKLSHPPLAPLELVASFLASTIAKKIENRSKPQFAKLFWLCDLQRFELPIFCSGSFSGVVLCDDGEEEGSPMEGRGSCENILRDNSTFHIHSLPYPFLCVDWRSVDGET